MATISFDVRGKSIHVTFYVTASFRPRFATGEKIDPKNWDSSKQSVTKKEPKALEINLHLQKIKNDLLQLWRDNKTADHHTLKELARKAIKGDIATVEKKTIYQALDQFLSQYKREKERITLGKYNTLRTQLLAFNPDLDFPDLDFNFYDAFKRHLYAVPNLLFPGHTLQYNPALECYDLVVDERGEPVGLFDDTVYKYFINLKTFLAWAVKRDYPVNPSFKSWEIIKRKHPPISLTLAELESLENLSITTDIIRKDLMSKESCANPLKIKSSLEAARDYLVAECRTGARVSDLKRFDLQDVKDMVWTYTPKKGSRLSSKKVSMPFVGYSLPAWYIFQRNGFKMPKLSEQKLNQNIKKVCKLAGITDEISIYRWQGSRKVRISGPKYSFCSTHVGRKTCISILHKEFEAPIKVIMDMVGINSMATIQHYLSDSEMDIKEKYLSKYKGQSVLRKAQ